LGKLNAHDWNTSARMTGLFASAIVGAVFLITGALKAVNSGTFIGQVYRYRLLSPRFATAAAILFIGLECGLGAALISGLSPWLLPLTMALLVAFAALTFWGEKSGRVEDCGCYGGLLLISPKQSIALDAAYFILAAVAWAAYPAAGILPRQWAAIATAVAFAGGIASAVASRQRPLVELSLLRAGHRWGRRWVRGYERDLTRGSHFVVFLSRDCTYCKRWVPMLNVIEVQPDLPVVSGIMSLDAGQLRGFLSEHMIRFPIAHLAQSRISLMVKAYPTAVLIEDGIIREKWEGRMPDKYVERVRQFFQTVAPERKSQAFGG
jgi:hypothetical protein